MLGGIASSHSQRLSNDQPTADPAAVVVWEQAITAKGGRARLHAVTNILESYAAKRSRSSAASPRAWYVELDVFPDKKWYWADDRPTPLGVYAEMINLGHDLSYDVHEWDSGTPVNQGRRNASDWPIIEMQLNYLLESKWVKPVPVRLFSGTVDYSPVDIVQTTLASHGRVDFHFDKKSHLLLEVAFPGNGTGRRITGTDIGISYGLGTWFSTFSDYAEVNGIQMPRKVGHMLPERPTIPVSILFNVEYDPDIFEKPPSLKDGSDAWRRKTAHN